MKKLALISLMSLAGVASAGTLAPSANGASTTVDSTSCGMVQTAFTLKLSQNVGAAWTCDTTAAAVQTGSTKGKYVFGGGTAGGAVKQCGTTAVSTSTGYNAAPSSATGDGCS